MNAELRKQPATNKGAHDSNDEITNDPKPGTLHDLASQPTGNEAYQQYDYESFSRYLHLHIFQIFQSWENSLTPISAKLTARQKVVVPTHYVRPGPLSGASDIEDEVKPTPKCCLFNIDQVSFEINSRTAIGAWGKWKMSAKAGQRSCPRQPRVARAFGQRNRLCRVSEKFCIILRINHRYPKDQPPIPCLEGVRL